MEKENDTIEGDTELMNALRQQNKDKALEFLDDMTIEELNAKNICGQSAIQLASLLLKEDDAYLLTKLIWSKGGNINDLPKNTKIQRFVWKGINFRALSVLVTFVRLSLLSTIKT